MPGGFKIKQLAKCVGKYKKDSLLAPPVRKPRGRHRGFIPFITASLIDDGILKSDMALSAPRPDACRRGAVSLSLGVLSGNFAATRPPGSRKTLGREYFLRFMRLLLLQHRQVLDRKPSHKAHDGRHERAERVPDINTHSVRAPLWYFYRLSWRFKVNRGFRSYPFHNPVLGAGLYFIISSSTPFSCAFSGRKTKLNRVVQENLRGIRVVKSFVRGRIQISKFKDVIGDDI